MINLRAMWSWTNFNQYFLILFLSLFFGLSCSSYRGTGEYKRASDYSHSQHGESGSVKGSSKITKLLWPVRSSRHITQKFSPPKNPKHSGLDIAGKKNTEIRAAHRGRVIYAGQSFRGYGKMIIIEYNQKWASLYAHLNKISVKEGQSIYRGQKIGGMGRTGRATGVHLHFEFMKDKQPVDPLGYF